MSKLFSTDFAGRKISLKTDYVAGQADGAILALRRAIWTSGDPVSVSCNLKLSMIPFLFSTSNTALLLP